jgi:hypothetical protein
MLDSFLNAEQKYADFQFCKIFTISKTVGVWEQGAQENIWTEEKWSDGRLEKTT